MNILFAINEQYVQHFSAVLASLRTHHADVQNMNLHVMYMALDASVCKMLEQQYPEANWNWHDLSEYNFADLFVNAHISYETYFRVMAPEIIRVDKLLYLDSDLLVRSSLIELYQTDLEHAAIAAVRDYKGQERKTELGIAAEYTYVNAGVLLMNLNYWREQGLSAKLLDYIRQMGAKLKYWDQDAINALLHQHAILLDDRWNVQASSFDAPDIDLAVLHNPVIIHFTGAAKPWHISNQNPFKHEYTDYLSMTSFQGFDVVTPQTYQLLKTKKQLYIWGAGPTGKAVYEHLQHPISGFIDSDPARAGTTFADLPVFTLAQIPYTAHIGILVCSGYFKEIAPILEAAGYTRDEDFVHQM